MATAYGQDIEARSPKCNPCESGATSHAHNHAGSRYDLPCLADQWCISIVDTADSGWIHVEVGSSRGVLAEAMWITISIRYPRGGVGAAVPSNRGLKVTFKNIAK